MDLFRVYDELLARIEADAASDREVARLTGVTIEQFDADTTAPDPRIPDHRQSTNRAGRQNCCRTCHKCGMRLREVLDGELWCDVCQTYR